MNRRTLTALAIAVATAASIATTRISFEVEAEEPGPAVSLAGDGARAGYAITLTATDDAFPEETWESTLWVDVEVGATGEGAGELGVQLSRDGADQDSASKALDPASTLVLQVRDDDALGECSGACTVGWELWLDLSGELAADIEWTVSTRVDSYDADGVELPEDTLNIEINALEE